MSTDNETQAAIELRKIMKQECRTHLGKMFAPVFQPEKRIPVIPPIAPNSAQPAKDE